jgi:hypothetical protein
VNISRLIIADGLRGISLLGRRRPSIHSSRKLCDHGAPNQCRTAVRLADYPWDIFSENFDNLRGLRYHIVLDPRIRLGNRLGQPMAGQYREDRSRRADSRIGDPASYRPRLCSHPGKVHEHGLPGRQSEGYSANWVAKSAHGDLHLNPADICKCLVGLREHADD